jgi:hypothetical protein
MRKLAVGLIAVSVMATAISAQTQKSTPTPSPTPAPARRPTASSPAKTENIAPEWKCPTPLGVGVKSKVAFCEVMTGRDPAAGILIKFPPHAGPVTLTFDLHNRHTYSEEQVKAHKGFARYTATIGVLTMDNTLINRAVVQSEFRTAADLIDRINGGAGPGGIKAVAPTGTEPITMLIPESENQVSILGEKLLVERLEDSATYTQAGRPIADISNVMIEYTPPPPPKRPAPKKR